MECFALLLLLLLWLFLAAADAFLAMAALLCRINGPACK